MTKPYPIPIQNTSTRLPDRSLTSPYLRTSTILEDGGEKIGINPSGISMRDLKGLGGPQKPLRAIRAHCLECSGDKPAEARKCIATGCNLWSFRFGRNPFHASAKKVKPAALQGERVSIPNTRPEKMGGQND